MRYSDTVLTDDNFDEEIEKLAELIGIPHTNYEGFVEKLGDSFTLQTGENTNSEEWIKSSTYPGNDGMTAYQKGYLAYEFGNGFVVFNFDILV